MKYKIFVLSMIFSGVVYAGEEDGTGMVILQILIDFFS